jgi:hypothetical protein
MKVPFRLMLVAFAATLLGACAGTHQLTSTQPAVQQELTPEQEYVAYVERVARRRGLTVTWVNPPNLPDKPSK